jgi:acylphosphatase
MGAEAAAADLHLTVRGIVQGVWFRDGMVQAAAGAGVDGWVRNRPDGTVEAVLRGAPSAREQVLAWARRGPPAARVERVDTRPARPAESALVGRGFRRLPTA